MQDLTTYFQNLAILRNMDPEDVVDTLAISTDELIDSLLEYIEEWSEEHLLENEE